jgi:hypothetical protein
MLCTVQLPSTEELLLIAEAYKEKIIAESEEEAKKMNKIRQVATIIS